MANPAQFCLSPIMSTDTNSGNLIRRTVTDNGAFTHPTKLLFWLY